MDLRVANRSSQPTVAAPESKQQDKPQTSAPQQAPPSRLKRQTSKFIAATMNKFSGAASVARTAQAGEAKPVAAAAPKPQAPVQAQAAPPEKKSGGILGFFKSVGNAIGGAVKTVGNAVGTVADGVKNAVVGVAKNVVEGLSDVGSGIGKLFQGKFGEGFKQMGVGLLKTAVQTPVDALLMVGGKLVSGVQQLIGVEKAGRKLSDHEIGEMRKVYGDSIDFSKVTVKEGGTGIWGKSMEKSGTGAFVHGNTIYVNPDYKSPAPIGLLMHEVGHIWQHQNGGTDYMSEALFAQKFGDAYDWKKAISQGKSFEQMDPEQKAEFMADAYEHGYFDKKPGSKFEVGGVDYTAALEHAIQMVRGRKGAP